MVTTTAKFTELPVGARLVVGLFGAAGVIELLFSLHFRPSVTGGMFFFMLALAVAAAIVRGVRYTPGVGGAAARLVRRAEFDLFR